MMKRLACSILIASALLAPACMRDGAAPMNDPDRPSVSVDTETLTRISATLVGSFGKADGIVSYGFEITGTNFDDSQGTVIEVSGLDEDGRFYHTAEVQPGAYYAVRSFISDGHNKKYSEDLSLNVPRSSVATPSEVSIVNDRLYARVVDDGGRTIRDAGFCWGESPDSKTIRLSRLKARLSDDGTFSADFPEMQPGRTYYFLAYLENAAGSDEAFGYSRNPGTYFISEEEAPVEIEDQNFFRYLLGRFDSDKDGKLTKDELKEAADITVSTDQIASLQGIEYMPLLTSLDCRGSSPGKGLLESVDISRNPLLSSFRCANNRLTGLDLSAADGLELLDCSGNGLTQLDLSGCFRLVDLDCSDNMLSELDVTGQPYLRQLSFRSNPVASIDISFCPGLEKLDGTDCPQLRWVYLSPGQYEDEKMIGSCRLDPAAVLYPVYVPIQDDNLYKYVVSLYDSDGDSRISAREAAAVTRIEVCTDNISSMSGIELFYNLEELICRSCNTLNPAGQLSALDISRNRKLTYLDCSGNRIDKLDLSVNEGLTTLICDDNLLGGLDFSGCRGLERLRCSGNQLSALDVSHNPLLKELNVGRNAIASLDLSGCPALESLDCSSNGIEVLDLSGLTALSELKCSHNRLESLDVSGNVALETLWCEDNGMTFLDLTGNQNLVDIRCDNVNIPDAAFKEYLVSVYDRNGDGEISLDEAWNVTSIEMDTQRVGSLEGIRSFGNLQRLICSGAQSGGRLTALDLSGNRKLTYLDCSGNQLVNLDVSGLSSLEGLNCSDNRLSALDVSHNPLLKELNFGGNAIASPDLSGCTALESLDCSSNGIKTLDPAILPLLSVLKCSHNEIEILEVSDNAGLDTLWCEDNSMTWLNVTANKKLVDIRCDNVHIPDAAFKAYLVSLYDRNSDGEISLVEAWDIRHIEVGTRNIASVAGIGSFLNLEVLICSDDEAGGQLTALDVSGNRNLSHLDCHGNRIAELDLSRNEALTSLICNNNRLTSLDVSGNGNLGLLQCSGNLLSDLSVSGNVMLKELYLAGNRVGSLDLSRCTALEILDCSSNALGALALSGLSGLLELKCSDNMLESLTVSGSTGLKTLWCEHNRLPWLNVTGNKELVDIRCDNVYIPDAAFKAYLVSVFDRNGDREISLVEAWEVRSIDVGTENISSLEGIGSFRNLQVLICTGGVDRKGGLTGLDLSQNPKLIEVDCSENQLDQLDVSHNRELRYLSCDGMRLRDLDVSNNARLIELSCSRNALQGLDVSGNTYLERLDCSENHLFGIDTLANGLIDYKVLDVSKCTSLVYLNCRENDLPGYLYVYEGSSDTLELWCDMHGIMISYKDNQ